MKGNYPSLTWGLRLNDELGVELCEEYEDKPRYLSDLDKLFSELIDLNVINIQEKILDVGTSVDKFHSILSELRIAKFLSEYGMEVQLLEDDYFEHKSPDLLCKKDNLDIYVEVMRLSESQVRYEIIDFLRDYLSDLPIRIDLKLKKELSLPARRHLSRRKQREIKERSLKQFKESFQEEIDLHKSPIQIDTEGIIFEIYQIDSEYGYPGILLPEVIKVPEEDLQEDLKYRLIKKAEKREKWEDTHLTYPYIIAFDCKERSIDYSMMDGLLYGRRPTIFALSEDDERYRENSWNSITNNNEKEIPFWNKIEAARDLGWGYLLIEKHLIPNNFTYLSEGGLFLSEPKMENVTGVLCRGYGEVSYFANPFANSRINCPGLIIP